MIPPRFFVGGRYVGGERVELCGGDARKIAQVLRMRSGDHVEIIDSGGHVFDASLEVNGGSQVRAVLGVSRERPVEATLQLTLAQGIPKGQKMDFVVEKTTELGVAGVIPFFSERTIGAQRSAARTERWRRLALSAAQQAGRTVVPTVEDPVEWEMLLGRFSSFDTVLVAWELAERVPLQTVLPNILHRVRKALVVIGPEGGIAHAEAHAALAAGAHALALGPRILRTETAGLVACSAILYAAGEI